MSHREATAALDQAILRWKSAWKHAERGRCASVSDALLRAWQSSKLHESAGDGKFVLTQGASYEMSARKKGSRVDYYLHVYVIGQRPKRNPLRSLREVQEYCRVLDAAVDERRSG